MLILKLAWRNLFRNTRRTVLTVTLIALSLTALIITDGMVIGLIELMTGNVTHILAGEAQIHRKGYLDNNDADMFINDPGPVIGKIKSNETVLDYAPRVMSGGMVTSSYNVAGSMIYGVDAVREVAVSKIKSAVIEGHYLTGGDQEIIIGGPLAELLEVSLHDRIVLTTAEASSGEISQALFRITGIFEFGLPELDENLVFINLAAAQRIMVMDHGIHQIAVRFRNPEDAKNRDNDLYKDIGNNDIEVLNWLEFSPQIAAMIEMSNYVTLVTCIILFFLAALGIINSMFMSIYERIYEFGVVMAIGTAPGSILKLVMLEALLIALISSVTGNIIGYFASSWFEANGIPVGEFEISSIVIDSGIHTRVVADQFIRYPIYIMLLTLVAAVYPAVFAARITPSEALQRSL
ncbi:MAG: ABC transporter permease [Gammaproteobacteria bacterium]|nr:ABC transporter permease [Gammaproteobacteria bacterium]